MHTVSSLRFFTTVGRLSRRSFALTLAALFGGTGLFLTFYNNLTLPIVYGVSASFPGEPLRAFRLLNTASSLPAFFIGLFLFPLLAVPAAVLSFHNAVPSLISAALVSLTVLCCIVSIVSIARLLQKDTRQYI